MGCFNRCDSDRRSSFYRIIAVTSYREEREFELLVTRRAAFLATISREDLGALRFPYIDQKHCMRVDESNIDEAPTLHLGCKEKN